MPQVAETGDTGTGDAREPSSKLAVSRRRRTQLPPPPHRVSLPIAGPRTGARRGWLRACGQPSLERRPVAARDGPLPAAVPPVHGEGGALLVPARAVHRRLRRLPG